MSSDKDCTETEKGGSLAKYEKLLSRASEIHNSQPIETRKQYSTQANARAIRTIETAKVIIKKHSNALISELSAWQKNIAEWVEKELLETEEAAE